MPRPTPVKIAPPASPRRPGGTCGSTVGAASTISAPPAPPAAARQAKNHQNEIGAAQAKKAAVTRTIIARSTVAGAARRASGRAPSAPAR